MGPREACVVLDYVGLYALDGSKYACLVMLVFFFEDEGSVDFTMETYLLFASGSITAAITRYGLECLFQKAELHKRFTFILQTGDNGSNLSCYQLAYWASTLFERYKVEWQVATLCPRHADNECGPC